MAGVRHRCGQFKSGSGMNDGTWLFICLGIFVGTSPEQRVTEFLQIVRGHKCTARQANGEKCNGIAVLKTKKKHRSLAIPDNVDETLFLAALNGQPLVADNSKDTRAGCVGATVAKVDNASSTKLLLGGKRPGEFAPALQSNVAKQKLVREEKLKAYPQGLGVPVEKDGGTIILTLRLLDDEGVTSFETETTFRRVAGDFNEWEMVMTVTIARAYVDGASTDFFERLYDKFQEVKMDLTNKPVAFKRFVEGGNILAMNFDMEAAQVLGAARSFSKLNKDEEYSKLAAAEKVAPEIIKLCTTHGKRGVLELKPLVSESDFQRLMDFIYIDSPEGIEEMSEFVRSLGIQKIQDWWDHKALSAWILPCLVKSQCPMSADNWENTPATTNTGEGQHTWTNSHTDTGLTL
ncbi:hypothetical protein C8R43DRAFT_1151551 [Mycena crocata]|nr:hypothetical protein C8R43DRAFT_1151551 [Mycena crocata]